MVAFKLKRMAKKIKKHANSVKNTNTNINRTNKTKIAVIKDRNVQFKSKSKKNKYKLAKKFKQIHTNEKNHAPATFVDNNSAKVLNAKNKGQDIKSKFQIKNKKKKKAGNSNQSNNEATNNKNFLKEKSFKNIKHNKDKKQINKTIKVESTVSKKQNQKNVQKRNNDSQLHVSHHKLDVEKLEELLTIKQRETKNKKKSIEPQSLRERMMTKLRASRFRYLNETLYNSESSESKHYFKSDPDAFKAYHEGYKQQVEQWPLNPVDIIISSIKKMSKDHIIADFGCGEAKLAASVPHKVHSFDFVSLNENVTVCDVAHTPLLTSGVHIVVFCLSLMGTNLKDYIIEANRVLKKDGILKIAEVESRFEQIEDFIKTLDSYGFKNTWKDLSHNLFYFLDFKKERDIGNKRNKLPPIILKPCLYKKR